MSDLCLEKIKNMLGAHDDGVYALEARDNLYHIISYLVVEVELNDMAIDTCRTTLDKCQEALGDAAPYCNQSFIDEALVAIKKAREVI
jgi:hypothetical protein